MLQASLQASPLVKRRDASHLCNICLPSTYPLHKALQRCRSSAALPAQSATTPQQGCDSLASLREWITCHGGYIHPALRLVELAPTSGCRGIVSSAPITLEDLEAGPIISIPVGLHFTDKTALSLISQHAGEVTAAAAEGKLSSTHLIAAALAQELSKLNSSSSSRDTSSSSSTGSSTGSSSSSPGSNSSSFWTTYLRTLPAPPPNPWLLTQPNQLAAAIAPYAASQGSEAVAYWPEATAEYRQQMLQTSKVIAALLQPTSHGFPPGPEIDQIMVALGHVTSRMLSSSNSSGLLPYIDLLNHGPGAAAPMLQLDDNDNLAVTVLPIKNVSHRLLQPMTMSCNNAAFLRPETATAITLGHMLLICHILC